LRIEALESHDHDDAGREATLLLAKTGRYSGSELWRDGRKVDEFKSAGAPDPRTSQVEAKLRGLAPIDELAYRYLFPALPTRRGLESADRIPRRATRCRWRRSPARAGRRSHRNGDGQALVVAVRRPGDPGLRLLPTAAGAAERPHADEGLSAPRAATSTGRGTPK
jgi:hypothetical protein